jgi:uncharacterized phage protein (TIGR02218 family)
MKRLYPSSLKTFLASGTQTLYVADLFQIALPNGQTITATSGQWGITVPSGTNGWVNGSGSGLETTTFHATTYGSWSRGAITSELSNELSSNSMELTLQPGASTEYPGLAMPILQAAANGLFDGAEVWVWTAYMPGNGYGNVSNGIETKFLGFIDEVADMDSTHCVFACVDPLHYLGGNAGKIPKRCFQPDCPWSVGDANCTLNLSGTDTNGYHMTQAFTAANGSNQYTLVASTSFTQPSGYFTQGVVTCTAGSMAGFSWTVQSHVGNTLTLASPMLLAPNVGDTFSVIVGCDKTAGTCQSKFGNLINHGGTPFVPPATQT